MLVECLNVCVCDCVGRGPVFAYENVLQRNGGRTGRKRARCFFFEYFQIKVLVYKKKRGGVTAGAIGVLSVTDI